MLETINAKKKEKEDLEKQLSFKDLTVSIKNNKNKKHIATIEEIKMNDKFNKIIFSNTFDEEKRKTKTLYNLH